MSVTFCRNDGHRSVTTTGGIDSLMSVHVAAGLSMGIGRVAVGFRDGLGQDSREVDFLQPWISSMLCLNGQPLNGGEGVIVGHGKLVLRRQSVLYRKDDAAGLGAEAAEEGVLAGPGRATEIEASPVEVNDQGKLDM